MLPFKSQSTQNSLSTTFQYLKPFNMHHLLAMNLYCPGSQCISIGIIFMVFICVNNTLRINTSIRKKKILETKFGFLNSRGQVVSPHIGDTWVPQSGQRMTTPKYIIFHEHMLQILILFQTRTCLFSNLAATKSQE